MSIPHDDYDSPWKNALEEYFEEFMQLFFPPAHADINWHRPIEFLDKELQQVALDAETGRRYADKLAKVWKKSGEPGWVLAHVEAERHMQYVSSAERFAMQKGEDKGRQEGAVRLLLHLLTHRFGEVSETIETRLQRLSIEQTEALVDVALASQSLTEFADQLPAAAGEITPSD